jgi:hypothetical protein
VPSDYCTFIGATCDNNGALIELCVRAGAVLGCSQCLADSLTAPR